MVKPDRRPRYFWEPTWIGRDNDFHCEVDGKIVARMYLHHTGAWTWFMNASWLWSITGAAETPLEAACAAEDAYDRAVEIYEQRKSNPVPADD